MPNQYWILALDRSLEKTFGDAVNIDSFVDDSPLPLHLAAHEAQYFLAKEDDPEMVLPIDDPVGRQRSCIFNTLTGESRYEVPIQVDEEQKVVLPKTLHLVADEGPIGKPAQRFLFGKHVMARGTKEKDRCHNKKQYGR